MASITVPEIILFWYDNSVYSRRMDYYLQLRGLPYKRVVQPPNLPRPNLERLGINYRRIPLLAIGRDIYIDTRIIIEKLEQLFPDGALGSKNPFEQGMEKVLESWIIDAGPFWRTAGCIPLTAPRMKDPVWLKDRFDGSGGKFTPQALKKGRPENLAHLRMYYGIAETLLGDGRDYIFNTSSPSLGDVHAIWTFDWGITLTLHAAHENAGEDVINEQAFPRVFAWVKRFRSAYKAAVQRNGEPGMLPSEDAISRIIASDFFETEGQIDPADPLHIQKGQTVKVSPSDFGSTHVDEGRLVSISSKEVAIETKVPGRQDVLRLHYPRNNFRIVRVNETAHDPAKADRAGEARERL